jgi:hypothetical protein
MAPDRSTRLCLLAGPGDKRIGAAKMARISNYRDRDILWLRGRSTAFEVNDVFLSNQKKTGAGLRQSSAPAQCAPIIWLPSCRGRRQWSLAPEDRKSKPVLLGASPLKTSHAYQGANRQSCFYFLSASAKASSHCFALTRIDNHSIIRRLLLFLADLAILVTNLPTF